MSTLDRAIQIAVRVHSDQKDRYGRPYILHPIRVMMTLQSNKEMMAAILHDVVEDSDMTLEDLRQEGFSEDIVAAIDCLTKRDGEPYFDYLDRVKPNPLAVSVKLADLQDNMDLTRVTDLEKFEGERFARYLKAKEALQTMASKRPRD